MSRNITTVAIAGANGDLGIHVTEQLLKAGFQVTALTRDASKVKLPSVVPVVSVDYDSLESLKSALQGQDALVSTIGGAGLSSQMILFDAAVEVGVSRIIPSEFGSDHNSEEAKNLPVYKDKVDLEQYIIKKIAGTDTTYTIITNNAFFDWGLEKSFIINLKKKKVNQFDGGDVPFTVTNLTMVGEAVASVLRKSKETANREVRVHGATVTINGLHKIIQQYISTDDWEVIPYDTVAKNKEAFVALQQDPGNVYAWLFPMIYRAAFGKGMSTDFSKDNDNDLLGLKSLTKEEINQVVKDSLVKVMAYSI